MANITYIEKINNTKIYAERAKYTEDGKNIDTELGNKATKVSSATEGNLASLDANGNIADSGVASANLVHDASYVHTDNNYTTAEKNKLSGIASNAQVNVIETIKVNGTDQTVTGKAVDIAVPVAGTGNPKMDGTASAGSATTWSKSDHVHPTDTSREASANKVSAWSSTTTDTHYPSEKLVKDSLDAKAPLASPALTGTPTAPTATAGTNTTQLATTAFVKTAVDTAIAGVADALVYKGTIAGGSTGSYGALTPAADKGYLYKVSAAGMVDGVKVEVGDVLICNTDGTAAATSSNYATIAGKWDFLQTNIDGYVLGPSSSVNAHIATFDGTSGNTIKDSGYTIATSVPSGAVFTDTKVTSSGNHYAPETATGEDKSASATGATAAWGIDVVKGVTLNTDGKGHVTGISVTSGKIPSNPNTDTKVKATAKTDDVNYKILATASASPTSGNATEAVYDADISLNPSTNTITANISGNAATATAASSAVEGSTLATALAGKQDSIGINATSGDAGKFLNQKGAWITGPIGPSGPTGATGPCGPKGDTGSSGPRGFCGPIGLCGPIGETGSCGPKGFCGPIGLTGATGPQGFCGPIGLTGATGPCGPSGVKGDTGATGPKGFCGPIGLTGETGPQGFCGPKGSTGACGPQGFCGPKGEWGGEVDQTYSATSTNPQSGKAVAQALAGLDVDNIAGFGAGKTLSALSETDGKISASFQDISITKSQVSDFSHTHGNIQNGGTLQTTDVTIANGDKLVVTDASDSNKVARTSVTFDGSTTTKALTQKGTFETVKEADVDWGGSSRTELSPIEFGNMARNLVHNPLPSAIKYERSNDGGTTWSTEEISDATKIALFNTASGDSSVSIPNSSYSGITDPSLLRGRITLYAVSSGDITAYENTWCYGAVKRILIYCAIRGAGRCLVELQTGPHLLAKDDVWSAEGTYEIAGDTGWNSIPLITILGGYADQLASRYVAIRFTFWVQRGSTPRISICRIGLLPQIFWTSRASSISMLGVPVSVNDDGTGYISASGKLSRSRKLAVSLSNTSTDTSFDGSADVTNIKTTGTLPVANGGTGKTTWAGAANAIVGDMNVATSEIADGNYIVFRYQTPSDANGAVYSRQVTCIPAYVKTKLGINSSSGSTSKFLNEQGSFTMLPTASTTTSGIVQLQDSIGATESSTTTAATPHAVRSAIDSAVSSAYHHAGTKTVAQLVSTLLVADNEGNVYNITDSGTTTSDFIEGAGHPIRVGDNVGICDIGSGVYKFDLLSGFVDLSNYIQKSSTAGLVKNNGTIDTSSYLTTTGAGQNVTSTFTKNASDTSGMTSGGKLSALFTAISNFFASLKALAFKDKVADGDISGTISDSHIASASTWSGKQSALPTSGTASTTYAINVSGTASNIAAGGSSGQYLKSNGGSTAPSWATFPTASTTTAGMVTYTTVEYDE